MILGLLACGPAATVPTGPDLTEPVPEVVSLTTRDGVSLEADVWTGPSGAPGIVLLHMTPTGGFDRTDWPRSFVGRLVDRGWGVLAVDRRGAGASGGVAEDAFGPPGWLDVVASVEELGRRGAGPIALMGASNGTTAALDYAVQAGGEGLPVPVAMGFMTGGTYTETQHPMSALGPIPSVFTFSSAEAAWSVAQQPLDPGTWAFVEVPNGAHGTQMFAAHPEIEGDLEAFLADRL